MALSKYAEKRRARRAQKQRRLAKPLLASAILVSIACAKQLETPADDDAVASTGGTGARGGSTGAHGGSGGSGATGLVGTGGSVGATGGSAALGGTGGSSGVGAIAGTSTNGGRSSSGGTGATAGQSASGGTNSAGGTTGVGGTNATGGMPNNGGTTSAGGVSGTGGQGGTGSSVAGSYPMDPNWKAPDMSAAKLVVLYQATQTAASSRDVRMTLTLKNTSDTPYDLTNVTIRYWMTAEPAPVTHLYFSSSNLNANTPTFNTKDGSYLKYTFKKGGSVPVYVDQNSLNNGQLQGAVDTMINNVNFNQSNDWSYDGTASAAAKLNPKITVYDGATLIFGCDPWHNCADTSSTGAGGAGGQPGAP